MRTVFAIGWLACAAACSNQPKVAPPPAAQDNVVALEVTERGFAPAKVKVQTGKPVKLVVTRKTDKTCATELVVPGYDIKEKLPLGEPVEIAFTPRTTGELRYGCAMDQMVSGVLLVE